MDSSWSRSSETTLRESIMNGDSLRLCVDGGRRSDEQAAMGFVLFSVSHTQDGNIRYVPILRKAGLLTGMPSAFLAEILALEWALKCLSDIVHGKLAYCN